ncbi:MAG: hypothetical protein ACRD3G_14950 [Vicinamibacterales bacterium]
MHTLQGMRTGGRTANASRRTPTGIVVACLMLLSVSAFAQRGDSRRFEVASVKINKTEVPLRFLIGPANRVYASRVDLRQVIWNAYGVDRLQVVWGPRLDGDGQIRH